MGRLLLMVLGLVCGAAAARADGRPRPVRKVVKLHKNALGRCYSRITQFAGGPDGTVMLHFTVQKSGAVTNVSAESELDARITRCVVAEARTWKFPVDTYVVRVNYPLEFHLAR